MLNVMLNVTLNKTVLFLITLTLSSAVFAGGMCNSASAGPSLTASTSFSGYAVDARTDRKYRMGKLAYAKRDVEGKKIKYCVIADGEAKRVTRSRLKALHGSSVLEFAQSLVLCDQPEQLALMQVADRSAIPNIIYYLAMNYGVNLTPVSASEQIAQATSPTNSLSAGQ